MTKYYYVKLPSEDESAALLAALSRYLNYPHGAQFLQQANLPEAWWSDKEGTLVFNETARDAIVKEFGNFSYQMQLSAPDKNVYIEVLDKNNINSMGMDDAKAMFSRI